jgi:DNA-binding NarL/FixJ family response regulator
MSRGKAVFTAGLAVLVLGKLRRRAAEPAVKNRRDLTELTARETEVLQPVATGMSCKQFGGHLFISHRTVQNDVQNTLSKLQLHNRVGLVRFSTAKGLVSTIG